MAFASTAVSLPSLLTNLVFHIRSDTGNANADLNRSVSDLIELAAARNSLLPAFVHVSYQRSSRSTGSGGG